MPIEARDSRERNVCVLRYRERAIIEDRPGARAQQQFQERTTADSIPTMKTASTAQARIKMSHLGPRSALICLATLMVLPAYHCSTLQTTALHASLRRNSISRGVRRRQSEPLREEPAQTARPTHTSSYSSQGRPPHAPHIVVIMADDLGWYTSSSPFAADVTSVSVSAVPPCSD